MSLGGDGEVSVVSLVGESVASVSGVRVKFEGTIVAGGSLVYPGGDEVCVASLVVESVASVSGVNV